MPNGSANVGKFSPAELHGAKGVGHTTHASSGSKSNRKKKAANGEESKEKNKVAKVGGGSSTLSPFANTPPKSTPWKDATPTTRVKLETTTVEEIDKDVATAATSAAAGGPGTESTSAPPTDQFRGRLEELLTIMGDAAPEALKSEVQKFLSPMAGKDKIKHQQITKIDKLERQIASTQKEIEEMDQKWQEFVQLMRSKMERQKQAYVHQREEKIQALEGKTVMLAKLQEEIRKAAEAQPEVVKPKSMEAVAMEVEEAESLLKAGMEEIKKRDALLPFGNPRGAKVPKLSATEAPLPADMEEQL
ncbi:unnamed protein product [Durusdinium trenchii]|uniref:Uncharacterized protein n=1 Tax=Durusdinium trenchii TaxID=1381693 RepID=A0ABP0QUV1_9DINO